jgi:hypothetical protein
MFAILEPISAGIIVALFNRLVMPRFMECLTPPVETDTCDSSESASINADVEVHCHIA